MTDLDKATQLKGMFDRADAEMARRMSLSYNDGAGSAFVDDGKDGSVPTVRLEDFTSDE